MTQFLFLTLLLQPRFFVRADPVQDIVDSIDANRIYELQRDLFSNVRYEFLRFLSPERSREMSRVRDEIVQHMEGYGLDVTKQVIRDDFLPGVDTRSSITNIIGLLEGDSYIEEFYILCAHYDTEAGTPGVADNGSGVAALLEIARVLTSFRDQGGYFGKDVYFIAFDVEEFQLDTFLIGSYWWSKGADLSDLAGVINMDTIGFYSEEDNSQNLELLKVLDVSPDSLQRIQSRGSRGDFLAVFADLPSTELSTQFRDIASTYVPDLFVEGIIAPFPGSEMCTNRWSYECSFENCELFWSFCRSDHRNIWLHDKPGIFLTDTAENRDSCYHKHCDHFDKWAAEGWEFTAKVTRAVASVLATLASAQNGGDMDPGDMDPFCCPDFPGCCGGETCFTRYKGCCDGTSENDMICSCNYGTSQCVELEACQNILCEDSSSSEVDVSTEINLPVVGEMDESPPQVEVSPLIETNTPTELATIATTSLGSPSTSATDPPSPTSSSEIEGWCSGLDDKCSNAFKESICLGRDCIWNLHEN